MSAANFFSNTDWSKTAPNPSCQHCACAGWIIDLLTAQGPLPSQYVCDMNDMFWCRHRSSEPYKWLRTFKPFNPGDFNFQSHFPKSYCSDCGLGGLSKHAPLLPFWLKAGKCISWCIWCFLQRSSTHHFKHLTPGSQQLQGFAFLKINRTSKAGTWADRGQLLLDVSVVGFHAQPDANCKHMRWESQRYQHATCRHNHFVSLMRQIMLMFELARSLGTEIFAPKVIAEGVDWAQQEVISDSHALKTWLKNHDWKHDAFHHLWLKTWFSLNSITHFCQSPSHLRLLLFVGRCVQHETQWFDAFDLQCATFFQHLVTNHSQVHFSSVFQVAQELFQRHHLNCQHWRFTNQLW